MSEYLFLYRGPSADSASPEQMQQIMQKWLAWFKDLGEKGHIKNPGQPLETAGKVVRGRGKSLHHGPFAEAKDVVNGYTLMEAKDVEQPRELERACPARDRAD